MADSIRVIAQVTAQPGKEAELKSLLLELLEPTRSESGCIRYELLQDATAPTHFAFVEEWESEAAMLQHLESTHVQEAFLEGESLIAAPLEIRRYTLVM
ncbi:putative quinol monooxygenase [Leptolyngbya ohadii]|uniref:putative quinol monooxygenase n=1 Tax=Leptolyngbya ohadii TaxID=1962290 RepID=UPI000B598B10|nr:putative quinol monooxygenase [Leptolyngbya ohadii]